MTHAARSGAHGKPGRATRSVPVTALRAECTLMERTVLSERFTDKAALAPVQPGGASNPDKGAAGWLRYLKHLHRVHAVGVAPAAAREAGHEPDAAALQRAEQTVLDAMRDHPIAVPIDGGTRVVHVYPKSLDALLHVQALDAQLAWMTQAHARLMATLETDPRPDLADKVPEVLAVISYTYQLVAWIVTHPGPAMPYAPGDDHPEPPAEVRALAPWDVVRICRAHQQHLLRTSAVAALVDEVAQGETKGTRAGRRPTWAALYAQLEIEGVGPAPVLMKHRSLASLLATVRLSAARAEEARRDAERERAGRAEVSA